MNPAALPMLLTVANTLCGVTWGVYGFLVSNWFVLGPNIAGTVLNVMQLAVAIYITLAVQRDPSLAAALPVTVRSTTSWMWCVCCIDSWDL